MCKWTVRVLRVWKLRDYFRQMDPWPRLSGVSGETLSSTDCAFRLFLLLAQFPTLSPPPTLSPFCISVNNCLQHLLNSLFFLVVFFCHVQLKQQEIGASNQYKKRERMLEANRELPNLLLLLLGYWNIKCFHKAKSDKPASFFSWLVGLTWRTKAKRLKLNCWDQYSTTSTVVACVANACIFQALHLTCSDLRKSNERGTLGVD